MITYDDIKKILESVDIAKLEKDYMTRQEVNLLDNTMKAKDVLAYFPDELIYLPKGLDNIGKLNALLMLYLNSGHSSAKRLIIEILNKYGYNPNNELLRAIIIMNNAFKSGKSTLQALRIASKELPEPICDEFKKMYLDMKYGLSVDTVFERFSQRVKLEEASYVSSSLTILNKTGGNIVEVFSSIERTLFDRKKLNEELKNISSGPKLIVRVLFLVPIVFTLIIYLLNPSYFTPLFSSPLGIIIIGIIIVMFTIYILLLKKILKIEV